MGMVNSFLNAKKQRRRFSLITQYFDACQGVDPELHGNAGSFKTSCLGLIFSVPLCLCGEYSIRYRHDAELSCC